MVAKIYLNYIWNTKSKNILLFVNIPYNIDLNSFKNCRNDGQIMNLKVAHNSSTFTTVF